MTEPDAILRGVLWYCIIDTGTLHIHFPEVDSHLCSESLTVRIVNYRAVERVRLKRHPAFQLRAMWTNGTPVGFLVNMLRIDSTQSPEASSASLIWVPEDTSQTPRHTVVEPGVYRFWPIDDGPHFQPFGVQLVSCNTRQVQLVVR